MSESIKQAIIQPQVLHPTAESFYESALWKKEKEICISRMHRDSKEYEVHIHIYTDIIYFIFILFYIIL